MATTKQILFRDKWLEHHDEARAYKEAGFSGHPHRQALSRLMRTPLMQETLARIGGEHEAGLKVQEARAQASLAALGAIPPHPLEARQGRIQWLIRMMEGDHTSTREVPVPDGEGGMTTQALVESPDFQARLGAAKLLGQMFGDYVIKKEIAHTGTGGGTAFVMIANGRGPLPPETLLREVGPDYEVCGGCGQPYNKGHAHICEKKSLPEGSE